MQEVFAMSKTHVPYPPEYRQQLIELVRAGRTPGELAPLALPLKDK